MYNVDDYAKSQLRVFLDTYTRATNNLTASKAAMSSQQHRCASPVKIQVGDTVMVQVPNRNSKLDPKFVGLRLVVKQLHGNKFDILDPWLNTLEAVHCDRLKCTNAKPDLALVDTANLCNTARIDPSTNKTHSYSLRSRK